MLVYYVTMLVYLVPSRERTPVTHGIEFIETTMSTRQIKLIATDDELKELQKDLIGSPTKGDLLQKTGRIKKNQDGDRFSGEKRQCQGDLFSGYGRIIYLIMAWPKSAKDNLSDAERAELKKLTKLLKDEV